MDTQTSVDRPFTDDEHTQVHPNSLSIWAYLPLEIGVNKLCQRGCTEVDLLQRIVQIVLGDWVDSFGVVIGFLELQEPLLLSREQLLQGQIH